MKKLFEDYMKACKEQKVLIEKLEQEYEILSEDKFKENIKKIGDLNEKISECSKKIWGMLS